MDGVEVRDEHVSVIVALLPLDDRDDPLQSHSRIHILLRQRLQLTTWLPVWMRNSKIQNQGLICRLYI